MNPVFRTFLPRARGAVCFSGLDAWLLTAFSGLGLVLCKLSLVLGGATTAVLATALVLHRRFDHGRRDHLAIRLRAWFRRPRFNLNEPDRTWRPHGPDR